MSKISLLRIKDYLGVTEVEFVPGEKINIIKGEKGAGKTSIIDAIEKAYTNNDRRPKAIRKGTDEATIYIEQDDGFSIDRRIRTDKSDYLKLRKNGKPVKSTETRIRKILAGDIFRPLDWVKRSVKEQTESILNMIEIDWDKSDIEKWFGEVPQNGSINYSQHILQLLKDIERYYFDLRTDVNRKIRNAEARIQEIENELPNEYDGKKWRDFEISKLYAKLNDFQERNREIEKALDFIENIQNKLDSVELKFNEEIQYVKDAFSETIVELKNGIDEKKNQIEKCNGEIISVNHEHTKELDTIEKRYQEKLKNLNEWKKSMIEGAESTTENKRVHLEEEIKAHKFDIERKENEIKIKEDTKKEKVANKHEQMLKEKEQIKAQEKVMKEKANQEQYNVRGVKYQIEKAEEMKTFVRTWEKKYKLMEEIKENQNESNELTEKIETARQLPTDLLLKSHVPIERISVDDNGDIVINELPIQNLSEGELKELAMQIAREQAGELKVICLDGFNALNEAEQKRVKEEIRNDEFQYFLTNTEDGVLDYSERE